MKKAINIQSFYDYKKSDDIHGTALYPAVMVGPMQREVMREYLHTCSTISILDPFVGSGTALYEALQLNENIQLYGSDINPLAILISRVKIEGVSVEQIQSDLEKLTVMLTRIQTVPNVAQFKGIDKWFRPDIALSLQLIKDAINTIECDRNRRFFWYMLIDIIRHNCNSRSSTYKLHIRPDYQINNLKNFVIDDYLEKVNSEIKYFDSEKRNCASPNLNQGDSLAYLKSCKSNSFNLCITSPPYGDNETTVPYGQYSTLALDWINHKDVNIQGWELDTYAAIDSTSLGGHRHEASSLNYVQIEDEIILKTIEKICKSKQRKVVRFLQGYQSCLAEIMRVTESTIILTLGNRTVDGETIDLTGFSERYLESHGWKVKFKDERPIQNKRTPEFVSRVKNKPVKSMKKEILLIAECQR